MIIHGDYAESMNLGSSELVTINELVDIAEEIAGVKLKRRYNLSAPKGVNGRNSDNTLIRKLFNWEPSTRLRDGLERTYRWIHDQMAPQSPQRPRAIELQIKPHYESHLFRWDFAMFAEESVFGEVEQKEAVVTQISLEQALRLTGDAEKPRQSESLHPYGGIRFCAGVYIEGEADCEKNSAFYP
jgi:hypothetical protein